MLSLRENTISPAVQALFWAKAHEIPFVNMTDGTLRSESYIGTVQKLTRRMIVSGADSFLASGTKAAEKLLHWGADEERIAIAYLTVDTAPFLALTRQPRMERFCMLAVFPGKRAWTCWCRPWQK